MKGGSDLPYETQNRINIYVGEMCSEIGITDTTHCRHINEYAKYIMKKWIHYKEEANSFDLMAACILAFKCNIHKTLFEKHFRSVIDAEPSYTIWFFRFESLPELPAEKEQRATGYSSLPQRPPKQPGPSAQTAPSDTEFEYFRANANAKAQEKTYDYWG